MDTGYIILLVDILVLLIFKYYVLDLSILLKVNQIQLFLMDNWKFICIPSRINLKLITKDKNG